jgi:prophage regulatory protein
LEIRMHHSTPSSMPSTGVVRLREIIGDRRRGIPAIVPVSKSSWWAGVRSGRYPAAYKLGPRTTAWRREDIAALVAELGTAESVGNNADNRSPESTRATAARP